MPSFNTCAICEAFTEIPGGFVGNPVCPDCVTRSRVDALRPWDAELTKLRTELTKLRTEMATARADLEVSRRETSETQESSVLGNLRVRAIIDELRADLARVTARAEAAERERDARPAITADDCAAGPWAVVGGWDLASNNAAARIEDAIEAHAARVPR